jgi:hypothetical protein
MVGDDSTLASEPSGPQRDGSRPAAELVRVHDVGLAHPSEQARADGMGRMALRVPASAQDDHFEPAGLSPPMRPASEHDEEAVDVPRKRARQLEGIPFASSQETAVTEGGRRNVRDLHAASLTDHPW